MTSPSTGITPEAERAASTTIRELASGCFDNIHAAMESSYHLSVRAQDASLNETGRTQRQRLEEWIEEQVRPQPPRSQTRQSARHP